MSGIATRAIGWAAETSLSVASRSASFAGRFVSRAAISVAELPVAQRAAAGAQTLLREAAESPATAQFATTIAQASGKFVQTATQIDHAAIEAARGQVTLSLVDRLVAAEAHNAVLQRQLINLGHSPLPNPLAQVAAAAGEMATGAANASASVSAVARSGNVAVQASATTNSSGLVGRLVSRLNPLK